MAHMRDDYGGLAGLALLAFLLFYGGWLVFGFLASLPKHEASWAIQGEYSYLDCSSQPGTRPWYVEASDHEFFMGCQ